MSYEQELELLRDTFYKSRVTLSCLDTAQFYALCEVNPLQSNEQGEADASARKLFCNLLCPILCISKPMLTAALGFIFFCPSERSKTCF